MDGKPAHVRCRPRGGTRAGGFTIVELITVVMLLSILGVVAMARMPSPNLFAPAIVGQTLLGQLRLAQQLAVSRHDAVVTLQLVAQGADWRIQIVSDVDGTLRSERVDAAGTTIDAASGAASATLDDVSDLVVRFDHAGNLAAVTIGGAAGAADSGVALTVNGDSRRDLCIYASGYAHDDACR